MKISKIVLAMALALSSTVTLAAGDAAAGKAKFAMCQGCHGPNGVSPVPTYPTLAGKDAAYVKEQLENGIRLVTEYRSDTRAIALGVLIEAIFGTRELLGDWSLAVAMAIGLPL